MCKQSAILVMLSVLGLLTCIMVAQATDVNDDLTGTVIWTTVGSPYVLNPSGNVSTPGAITLLSGSLTINPGVVVKFDDGGDFSLIIDGGATLTAEGTSNSWITFTSGEENPSAGDWGAITFSGSAGAGNRSTGSMEYCRILYGGDWNNPPDLKGVIDAHGYADVTIENCEIGYCEGAGFSAFHFPHHNTFSVTYSEIYSCDYGIYIGDQEPDDETPDINNNKIYGITYDGIYTSNTDTGQGYTMEPNIKNNLISNCGNSGICLAYLSVVVNNTITHCDESALEIRSELGTGYEVKNNVFYDYSDYGIDASGFTFTVYNSLRHSSQGGSNSHDGAITWTNSSTSTPKLAITSNSMDDPTDLFDYHLLWNSPCLNAGDSTAAADTNRNGLRTDMGFYGGPDAPDDYYLGIKGRLAGVSTLDNSYNTTFRVVDDVTIGIRDSVYIGTSTDSLLFECLANVDWEVEGKLVVDGSSSNPIYFTAKDSSAYWDGIEIINSGWGEFDNFKLSYSSWGIIFSNSSDGDVDYVEIDHINNNAIKITSSEGMGFSNLSISDCAAEGMYVANCDLSLTTSTVENCLGGIYLSSSNGTIDTCEFGSNDKTGLYLYNSSPLLTRCYINENGRNGIWSTASSDVVLGKIGDNTIGNRLYNNGDAAEDSVGAAELCLYDSDPVLVHRFNDFVDTRTTDENMLLIWSNDTLGATIQGDSNYWAGPVYTPDDPNRWFIPVGYVPQVEWCSSPNRDIYTITNMNLAFLAEYDELWEDAAELYWDAFTEDDEPAALKRWIYCNRKLGEDPADLLDELDALGDVEGMESTLFWSRILLQNRAGEFETSIDQLDDFVSESETVLDSVQGMLSQLETYYMMALTGGGMQTQSVGSATSRDLRPFGLAQVGRYASIVPANYADYRAKREALMESASESGSRFEAVLPREFALHQNYPNPFNPSTTLHFDLVRPETVKLAVYNVMGQRVAELVNRPMQAGTHSVTFDASRLASGVYFYRIEAGSFTDMKRMVLVK